MPIRISVMVAATRSDGDRVKSRFPQYRLHTVVTPKVPFPPGFVVGEYLWTPEASNLRASVRLSLRGMLSPYIDQESIEEEFPDTLLSW